MIYYSTKEKEALKFHSIFLFILSLYYLIPYLLTGQLITRHIDLLEKEIVCDYILGRFYRGNVESLDLLLAGEVKWYMMWKIFHPLSLLYAFFETEVAFWLKDIIIKVVSYACFFKLSRKLNCKLFNSALIACLFTSSSTIWIWGGAEEGLGISALPYLIYLIIKNKTLRTKHYLAIIFIGLNTDLVRHVSIIPAMLLISLILFPKYQRYNFKLFFKISIVVLFFMFLSSSNLIYAYLFSEPFQRTDYLIRSTDLIANLKNLISQFFAIPNITADYYFLRYLPFSLFVFPIILISLFSKNKISYLLLLFIFFIHFFEFILHTEFITTIINSSRGLIKTLNYNIMLLAILPMLYGLLFINITKLEIIRTAKYLIYPLLFLSLISFQIRISVVPLSKHFLSFNKLNIEKQNQLKKLFYDRKYSLLIKEAIKLNKNRTKYSDQTFKSKNTFKGYYNYENYKYIKSLVGISRTISIGLDPMVAVMNNINVMGGFYNIYPLSYKLKFRKIIEKQLEHYEEFRKNYDNWGQRVYTFVTNPKIIKIDFFQANLLGAEYVISKYPISNKILVPICTRCNNSPELFLYKIKI